MPQLTASSHLALALLAGLVGGRAPAAFKIKSMGLDPTAGQRQGT